MRRFENWLAIGVSFWGALGIITLATMLAVLSYTISIESFETTTWSTFRISNLMQINFIVIQSMGEEVLYRLLPIGGIIYLLGQRILPIALVAIATAFIWGYVHVGISSHIAIYVVPSFLLTLVYLKMGGFSGRSTRGVLSAGMTHVLANIGIFTLGPIMSS